MTDADGHMKSDFGTYKDESIVFHIESFIQTDNQSEDDVEKAEDILIEEAEFASLRYLDTDDEEMPAFSACTDNNQFTENIMESFVDKNKHQALIYSYKEYAKKYPEKALDMVMAELDSIINCCPRRTEDKIKDKQIFIDLNNKRKTGSIINDGMKKYYNHDDPFAQCHTLKETLKSQLKPIITGNASRIGA